MKKVYGSSSIISALMVVAGWQIDIAAISPAIRSLAPGFTWSTHPPRPVTLA